MTLEEAITHAREIAEHGGECAEDHEQLAEWLEELCKLRAITATLGKNTLTAEQVKQIYGVIEKHWHDLPTEYDMPEATALPEYSYDWQAIADELNVMSGNPEIVLCKDCKHYDAYNSYCNKFGIDCYLAAPQVNEKPGYEYTYGDYGYCAWGERREQ